MKVLQFPDVSLSTSMPHGIAPDGSSITENFSAWFAGSAVIIDEKPLVLYHGTASNFKCFKHSKGDIGFHFGSMEQARVRLDYSLKEGLHKAQSQRILEVYLCIKKPLRLYDSGDWTVDDMKHHLLRWFPEDRHIFGSVDYDTGFKTNQQVRDYLVGKGFDGIVYANTGEVPGAEGFERDLAKARRALYRRYPEAKHLLRKEYLESEEYKRFKKAEDADQVFRDTNAQDSYIAFEPRQIKSVSNIGLFDPCCNDITDSTSIKVKHAKARSIQGLTAAVSSMQPTCLAR
jgi:hypothetical protein